MKKSYLTTGPGQTKKLGTVLAEKISRTPLGKKALAIGLEGNLGGGKTTFLQGFAKGLGIKEKITSPTFIVMKKFQITNYKLQTNSKTELPETEAKARKRTEFSSPFKTFYHLDCYRLEKPKEILDLGFKKIISNSKNIVAIEWSDKIKKILPRRAIFLKFKFIDKNTREIKVSVYPVF